MIEVLLVVVGAVCVMLLGLVSFFSPGLIETTLAVSALLLFLGVFVGTRTPESKAVMLGALGGLLVWSAVFIAVWQLYIWNLGREMGRAFNQ